MPTEGGPTFRKYDPKQTLLLPPNLDEWLPKDHLARIVAQVVDEHLDLAPLLATYHNESGGFPAFDPRLQLKVLLYGYCIGVASSRRMEKATYEDLATRWLAADQHPHFTTLARFRRRNLPLMDELFHQVLDLCREAGLVKLGRVVLDGTKIKASASKHTYVPSARGWYATSYPQAAAPGSALTYQRQFAHDEIRDRRLSTTFPNQGLAAVFNSAVFGPELGRSGV
jgi:transposase